MAGTIVTDRIESDASYVSKIELASPVLISNTFAIPAGTVSAPAITPTGDTNTGIFFPAADNIGFATNGVIRGRWTTDGLCFGSDTAAANALDDYEEGTWVPVVSSLSGFSGSITVTYATYMKIGNTVFIRAAYIFAGSSGNATAGDTVILTGLPFTPALRASATTTFDYNDTNGGIVRTMFATTGTVRSLFIVFVGAPGNTRADGGFNTYGYYQV